jgi:D-alanyl-D-alanine carboxypeptidase (penicillin-binding protein 5/6)
MMQRGLVLLAWAAGWLGSVCAEALPPMRVSSPPRFEQPQAPAINAKAWLLLDLSSGQILAQSQADKALPPASLTKLMTSYLVFKALREGRLSLDDKLPVSERAQHQPGSRMFLEAGQQVPVEDLLKGLLVQSGNDAAVALAEGVAGSLESFVEKMNAEAKALGLRDTRFHNPTGWPVEGQHSTAQDLALLATRLRQDFPQDAPFFAIHKYRYPGTPPANDGNRNLLLFRDPSVDGMKTGHVEAVGFSIIATAQREFPHLGEDGKPGPRRLLAVVLGAASEQARASETQKLLNWGYMAFESVKLFEANQPVLTAKVWKGNASEVRLGRPQAIIVTVPAGVAARLRTEAAYTEPLMAPLSRGQAAGVLKVYEDQNQGLVSEIPLLALDEVGKAGVIGQAWDAVRLWMQ